MSIHDLTEELLNLGVKKVTASMRVVDRNFTTGICPACKKIAKRKVYAKKIYYDGDPPVIESEDNLYEELKKLIEERKRGDIYCYKCKKVLYEK